MSLAQPASVVCRGGQPWWSTAGFKISAGTFSQVELGGLEPPTPCLQSMAKMSGTVYDLARSDLSCLPESNNVQACWCRLWVSSRHAALNSQPRMTNASQFTLPGCTGE